jgi:Flp pilus assembly protein TadG
MSLRNKLFFLHKAYKDQRGQMLPVVAFLMIILLGFAGLVVDFGHVYYSYRLLQASTDAAALAAAQGLPNQATAKTYATNYSSLSGKQNAFTNLTSPAFVSGYPLFKCLTTLTNQGIACVSDSSGGSVTTANAVQIKQQATVPTTFLGLFGFTSVPITATSTASMRGSAVSPYNVAIIIDTTASMDTTDTNCGNKSRLTCALNGVQVLLQDLSPCASNLTSCGSADSSGNVTNSVDRVSLFTFPNPTVGTVSQNYDCSSSNPTIQPYSFPTAGAGTYAPSGSSTPTYQVINFSSDYRTSDTASSLSSSSNLTKSVGAKSGCTGMSDPGGEGTYYAGAIYAAQAALTAEAAANPGSQNVIILLSDGDASASKSQMNTNTSSGAIATSGGTYPSWVNECGQAITAAKYAASQKTRVYSVAYGSASSGCSTDTSGTYKNYTPCQTMEAIASAPQYFFSDYNQSGSGSTCQSASQPTTNLNQIFTDIAGDLTVARLIPDNTA